MECSNCGKCCERTEMLLSKGDIERLEKVSFSREDFTVTGEDGLVRLRNVGRWCYFYDPTEKKCQVYEDRPIGCFLYPVIYSTDEGVIVDELCPMKHSISKHELKIKGKILLKHLKNIMSDFSISSFLDSAKKKMQDGMRYVRCKVPASSKRWVFSDIKK